MPNISLDDKLVNVKALRAFKNLFDNVVENWDSHIHYDTTANWSTKTSYVPASGDIIIYTDKDTVADGGTNKQVPGIKIGDGNAYVVDLPFVDAAIAGQINDHISNANIHVTSNEKTFWNNKLNFALNGETLLFNRD